MAEEVAFEEVLRLSESKGWRLQKIWEPYRVFVKEDELPFLIPVHGKKVDSAYVDKIKDFFAGRERD